jgi:peptide/nickel transport system substrate-binding protein
MKRMERPRWAVAFVGAMLAALLVSGVGSAGTASQAKATRTVVFGAEQEPPCLNSALADCNAFWAQVIAWTPVLRGAFMQQPDLSFKEDMVSKVVVGKKPFSLTYFIKPQARWSDGKPVTAQDFIFTWLTIINPKFDLADRTGYDQIQRAKALNDKTVKFIFKKPFAPWKSLFGSIFPKHVLQGTDFNTVWNNCICNPKNGKPIGNGPFLVQSYKRGQSITLVRNPSYWGARKGNVAKIVFRFITDTNSEIQAIRGGEVDAIYPQPQLQLADLGGQKGIVIQTSAGPTLEHIDFQLGPKGGPLERAPWVRQMIAYAIDREAATKQLFRTLVPEPSKLILDSLVYVTNQKEYIPHFNAYRYNPSKVEQIARAHGCTKGGDGIWVCQGKRLSYKLTSTAGNRLRELYFEVLQAQAKKAGIELTSGFGPARIVFGDTVFSAGNFELFMYAWVTNGTATWGSVYNCGGDSNFKGYCSKKVTDLLNASDTELDPDKRAALINKADALMAKGLPALPLYQKPTYFVFKKTIKNMVDNPSPVGPTWNAEDWIVG